MAMIHTPSTAATQKLFFFRGKTPYVQCVDECDSPPSKLNLDVERFSTAYKYVRTHTLDSEKTRDAHNVLLLLQRGVNRANDYRRGVDFETGQLPELTRRNDNKAIAP